MKLFSGELSGGLTTPTASETLTATEQGLKATNLVDEGKRVHRRRRDKRRWRSSGETLFPSPSSSSGPSLSTALVDELGFGVFSHLPNYYLKQKVLKEIYNRFDTDDHTIHAVAGEVEITTQKIGKALGLSSIGTPYDDKVTPKDLSEEDHSVYKFFQSKTQAALAKMIYDTPVDMEDNRKLFKRAFLLYVQKCFLLPTSAPNVTPRALPMLFNLENTRNQNWALHVHNFLLEEVKKAKTNNTKSVSGCCYAMLIIYFHETNFGKNSRNPLVQPPWIQYWKGDTLWKRMKQEKTNAADDTFSKDESDSEETRSESLVQVKSKSKRGTVSDSARDEGSSETLPLTQKRDSQILDGHTLAQAVLSIKKRKHQEREEMSKKRTKQPIEDPPIDSTTVSLGNDGSNAESGTYTRFNSFPWVRLLTDALMRMSQEEQLPLQEEDNNPAQIEEHPPRLERQNEEPPSQ
ncbi:hypothetical protein PIB30_101325 [Stylosanthes scabra]|uniref:Aminotransferase-like plant mobile domain-containing protein n=1 Tax=Stylosanthes scabra TaxID=79078 RepID=A0ABU6RY13_9FABA|nr:hypothetical protein [Stylosanthes scabra]